MRNLASKELDRQHDQVHLTRNISPCVQLIADSQEELLREDVLDFSAHLEEVNLNFRGCQGEENPH